MRKTWIATVMSAAALAAVALAEPADTPPTTGQAAAQQQPADPPSEQLLNSMLKTPAAASKALTPTIDAPQVDKKGGVGALAPNAPMAGLQREGTFIFDRVGRLTRTGDAAQAEFTFEADGKNMHDPPVIILPNLKLMTMEDAVKVTNRDLRFRVTGMLTEYRGRNYLLIEKVLVPPETHQQF